MINYLAKKVCWDTQKVFISIKEQWYTKNLQKLDYIYSPTVIVQYVYFQTLLNWQKIL